MTDKLQTLLDELVTERDGYLASVQDFQKLVDIRNDMIDRVKKLIGNEEIAQTGVRQRRTRRNLQQEVLHGLADGRLTVDQLANWIGVSETAIRRVLEALEKKQKAQQLGGTWHLQPVVTYNTSATA